MPYSCCLGSLTSFVTESNLNQRPWPSPIQSGNRGHEFGATS